MTTKLTFVRFHCDIHTAQQFPRNRPDHKLGRPETATLIYVNISGYPVFIKTSDQKGSLQSGSNRTTCDSVRLINLSSSQTKELRNF